MKGTMYRPAPKISPLYEQSMGGHRSPVPFNGEIPTPLRPLFVPERNRRSRFLARSSLRTGVGMTQYRNGPLSHGVRHDSSDIAQKGEPRGLRPAKFQFTCFPKYRPPGNAFPSPEGRYFFRATPRNSAKRRRRLADAIVRCCLRDFLRLPRQLRHIPMRNP